MQSLTINLADNRSPLQDTGARGLPSQLPPAKHSLSHPNGSKKEENGTIYWVGNATVVIEWKGLRILTDPNFLHAGDHVHLGPGVTSERLKDPAVDLHQLPRIDLVLLSHYHEDHFDKEVEASLRRDLPIISTPHAREHLSDKSRETPFSAVHALNAFESMDINITNSDANGQSPTNSPSLKVTAMPGKHTCEGIVETLNDLASVLPPVNGWMIEFGDDSSDKFDAGYRIYISGDTMPIEDLKEIPRRYPNIDLMLVHLGGTTIPGPKLPLLMVTMSSMQGVELIQLVKPDVTIPIHIDDYDVMTTSLDEFGRLLEQHGLREKVVFLERGDVYSFAAEKK